MINTNCPSEIVISLKKSTADIFVRQNLFCKNSKNVNMHACASVKCHQYNRNTRAVDEMRAFDDEL